MSITSIIDAFQVINSGITDVDAAPTTYPNQLIAHATTAITLPGQCNWRAAGLGGGRKAERTYLLRFYVAPADSDAGTAMTACAEILEAVGIVYRATKSVDGNPIKSVEDSGLLRTLGYGGAQYYGFEYRVAVLEES